MFFLLRREGVNTEEDMEMRNSMFTNKSRVSLVALAAALGLAIAWQAPITGPFSFAANAQESGGQGTGKGNQGGQGQGSKGAQTGQSQGQGQGGPGEDSDGKGPQAGAPSSSGGGKPTWSQEGIPEVELGRLNVARSPEHVLDQAYEEALASISPEMVSFYNLSLDQAIEELSLNWDNVSFIDSPLQNLGLLQATLEGSTPLSSLGVSNDADTLAAIFLGAASDKTVPITTDTVIAVTQILGVPVTGAAAASLAADAEAVRIAILAGHG
ncbi:hypothetical protein BMI88_07045 [Thioclava sp. F36-6]|nr:hypothetical protein BMI88_07045 [Thioclava sp. F36-6]